MGYMRNIQSLKKKPHYWGWVGGLYLGGNDDGVAMRLHDGQEYEPQSRKLWKRLCKDSELVVDVGAHTGLYSIDAWQAGARSVLSIEPFYMNFARLTMNLRHAGFNSHNCVMTAAHDDNCMVQLNINTVPYYCSAGASLGQLPVSPHARSYWIDARRLDKLIKREYHQKISVVKIDTEKHGRKVLDGMPEILSHRPDLILECIEPGLGEMLKPLGYKFYKINEMTGLTPVEDLMPDNPITHDSPNRYATVKEL